MGELFKFMAEYGFYSVILICITWVITTIIKCKCKKNK